MSGGLFRRDGDYRYAKSSTDGFSDVACGHSLFGDCVIPAPASAILERQPVQTGSIEEVGRGPAIEPIADVRRNALLAGETDRVSNKALLHGVVDLGKPHGGHADAAIRDGAAASSEAARRTTFELAGGSSSVAGRPGPRFAIPVPGGDDQESVEPASAYAESLDDSTVDLTVRPNCEKSWMKAV